MLRSFGCFKRPANCVKGGHLEIQKYSQNTGKAHARVLENLEMVGHVAAAGGPNSKAGI